MDPAPALMHTTLRVSTLLLLFVGACGEESSTTTDGTGSTSGTTTEVPATDSTSGTTDASTTAEDSSTTDLTTGVEPTTTDPTTTEPTTGETTAAETTTGGDPEVQSTCPSYCERQAECGHFPDVAECVAACAGNFAMQSALCQTAGLEVLVCVIEQSCEQILDAELDPAGPCGPQVSAASGTCYHDCVIGWGGGADACDMELSCPAKPSQKMVCDTQICTCFEDDQKTGECPAENICPQGVDILDKGKSCCGF